VSTCYFGAGGGQNFCDLLLGGELAFLDDVVLADMDRDNFCRMLVQKSDYGIEEIPKSRPENTRVLEIELIWQ
jgi:hypothetical protein